MEPIESRLPSVYSMANLVGRTMNIGDKKLNRSPMPTHAAESVVYISMQAPWYRHHPEGGAGCAGWASVWRAAPAGGM